MKGMSGAAAILSELLTSLPSQRLGLTLKDLFCTYGLSSLSFTRQIQLQHFTPASVAAILATGGAKSTSRPKNNEINLPPQTLPKVYVVSLCCILIV